MADRKISQFEALTSGQANGSMVVPVSNPASPGAAGNRGMSLGELRKWTGGSAAGAEVVADAEEYARQAEESAGRVDLGALDEAVEQSGQNAASAATSQTAAAGSAAQAQVDANRADTALAGTLAAAGSQGYKSSVAEGLATTTNGQVFWTVEGDERVDYQNVSGVATARMRSPSAPRVNAGYVADQVARAVDIWDERFAFLDLSTQVVTNLTDGASAAVTKTKVSGGLQLALTTASRTFAFSTANVLGGGLSRIRYHAETAFASVCYCGLSIVNGADRWTVQVQQNGWIVYVNTRTGVSGAILTNAMGAWVTGSTVDIELVFDGNTGEAQVRVSVNGAAPWIFGLTGVFAGSVQLIQRGNSTVIHRMSLEAIGNLTRKEIVLHEARAQADINAAAAIQGYLAAMKVKPPTGWVVAVPNGWVFYSIGERYWHNIDVQPCLLDSDPTAHTYHVDVATGLDTNPGTAALPIKSLKVAQRRIGAGARAIIAAKGGLYPYDNAFFGDMAGARVHLKSSDGLPVFSSFHYDGLTWASEGDNTWSSNLASNVSRVFDASILGPDGDYSHLPRAASLAACKATPGSCFVAAPIVYVHTADNRQPDAAIRVYRAASGTTENNQIRQTGHGNILTMDNVHFEGGNAPLRCYSPNNSTAMTLLMRRGSVKYSGDTGFEPACAGLMVVQDSVFAMCGNDGCNWQPSGFGGPAMLALEIDCIMRWCGLGTGSTTSNGSSSHGAAVVRINSLYPNNRDRNVHDITQGGPSLSWNLGCEARDSQTGKANWACGLASSPADASHMWLDGCKSSGGPTDIEVSAGAKVYTHAFTGAGANTGAGTIEAYTP